MSNFLYAKIKRFVFSVSGGYSFVFLTLFVTAAAGLIQGAPAQGQSADLRRIVHWVMLGLLVGFAFLVVQAWLEYRRRTHDPTWILKFQEQFNLLSKERAKASRCLSNDRDHLNDLEKYEAQLSDIDDVLDFFEDIGFYMRGDQISPEVVHHHFYHWIRGYWEASESYVKAWQRKEPSRWNHLKGLYETVTDVEARESGLVREQLVLEPDDVAKFLNDESPARGQCPDAILQVNCVVTYTPPSSNSRSCRVETSVSGRTWSVRNNSPAV